VLPVAEALAARTLEVRYVVEQPAAQVLRKRGHRHSVIEPQASPPRATALIEQALGEVQPNLVLLGSSPARSSPPETPEQFAILAARRASIPTLTVLDYWGMYAERFAGPSGKVELGLVPDCICVLDELCRNDLVAFGIPEERIAVTHNPWLDQTVALASDLSTNVRRPRTLVFGSQPLAENAATRGWTISQNELFSMLVDCARESGEPWRLEVWPHAGEHAGRWPDIWPERANGIQIAVRHNGSTADLAGVSGLATSHSTIAYEALHLGVPCICLHFDKRREAGYIVDRLKLAEMARTREELLLRLGEITDGAALARLARRRDELVGRGIFFSDGNATRRVLSEVRRLLGEAI